MLVVRRELVAAGSGRDGIALGCDFVLPGFSGFESFEPVELAKGFFAASLVSPQGGKHQSAFNISCVAFEQLEQVLLGCHPIVS